MTTQLAPLTETEFLNQVLDLATLLGWETAHFRPAMTSKGWRTPVQGSMGKGWPDLVLARPPRLIFVELKRDGGKLTPEQRHVLVTLARLQEDEDDCSCGLEKGVDLAHDGDCDYSNLKRGIQVFLWEPSGFDAITEILR